MDYYLQQIKNIYHLCKAVLAVWYYGNPSKHLTVIGVTGTDGKTTTSALIYHILKTSGKKVSVLTTVAAQIGDQSYDTGFHVTTPNPFDVQKYIKKAVDDGDAYFVLETTSHALDQYRVYGINFTYGIITNITHEHLHYHKTYENYVKAKARLLEWSQVGIINRDDESYEKISKFEIRNSKLYTYGLEHDADYQFDMSEKLEQPLAHFNKYNYLAAYAVCHEIGLSDEDIFSAMKTYQLPPGRMEVVYDADVKVIIDFAHTPNGLHEALGSIRDHYVKEGRLIHVFGAAAFRDDEKRPIMGRESGTYADVTILTEEDYRTEDPERICAQIAEGLVEKGFEKVNSDVFEGKSKTYTVLIDRKEAIQKAIQIAKPGDVIAITGKGHEKSLNRNGKEYDWDDKEAVLGLVS